MTKPVLPEAFRRVPIAHRALHDRAAGRIENSPSAIRAALDAGYGIEIDIQPAACGTPMVFHDHRLDRLTAETGPIAARTADALTRIGLTGGPDTIPTLAAVLNQVAGRVPLLIEIKDQDGGLGPDVGALEAAVARCLRGYGGPVAVMSFNPDSMAAMARAAPEIPRGLVGCAFDDPRWGLPDYRRAELAGLTDVDRVGAAFVSHDHRDLDNPAVSRLAARGVPILTWTIRSPAEETAARRIACNITFEGYRPAIPPLAD